MNKGIRRGIVSGTTWLLLSAFPGTLGIPNFCYMPAARVSCVLDSVVFFVSALLRATVSALVWLVEQLERVGLWGVGYS
jgi:hypothetical protein